MIKQPLESQDELLYFILPTLNIILTLSSTTLQPLQNCQTLQRFLSPLYLRNTDDGVMTNSTLVEIFVEFKWNSSDNPFDDVHQSDSHCQSFLHNSKLANDTLGQITLYAAVHLGAQFQTHIFSVFIV